MVWPGQSTERGSRRLDVHRRDRSSDGNAGLVKPPLREVVAGITAARDDVRRLGARRGRPGWRDADRRSAAATAQSTRGRSSSNAEARWRSTAARPWRESAFFDMLARVMPGSPRAVEHACGGRRAFTSRSSSIACDGSRAGPVSAGARSARRSIVCGRRAAASFSGKRRTTTLPLLLPGARRLPSARGAPQLRPGDRGRRLFQSGDDRRIRREPRRATAPSFYRHLFWESGVVGQALYLEAEAAGARATGIGCFYDDPVHDTLGLQGMHSRVCITSRSACRSKMDGSRPSRDTSWETK